MYLIRKIISIIVREAGLGGTWGSQKLLSAPEITPGSLTGVPRARAGEYFFLAQIILIVFDWHCRITDKGFQSS